MVEQHADRLAVVGEPEVAQQPAVDASTLNWLQCDSCNKWRTVSARVVEAAEAAGDDAEWHCHMNIDGPFRSCQDPDESAEDPGVERSEDQYDFAAGYEDGEAGEPADDDMFSEEEDQREEEEDEEEDVYSEPESDY